MYLAVQNAFLFSSRPHHPALEHIIEFQIQHVQARFYGPRPQAPTGPLTFALGLDHHYSSASAMVVRDLQYGHPDHSEVSILYDVSEFRYDAEFVSITDSDEPKKESAVARDIDLHAVSIFGHGGSKPMPFCDAWSTGLLYCDKSLRNRLKSNVLRALGYGRAGNMTPSVKHFVNYLPFLLTYRFGEFVANYEMHLDWLCPDHID